MQTIISIECPGATLNEMLRPLLNEMTCIKNVNDVKLVVVGGLNNFLRGKQSVTEIKNEAASFKEKVKAFNSNIVVNFVALPVIPQLSKLPHDTHSLPKGTKNRTNEILNYNSYVTSALNDTSTLLSMEALGIVKPISSFDSYVHSSNVKLGKMHIPEQWEERNLTYGVHLKKDLKRKFWMEQIKPFFGIANSS